MMTMAQWREAADFAATEYLRLAKRTRAHSDNGVNLAAGDKPQEHPFEAMLLELGIKHRYTRPYRPQTNRKVERFWRTLGEDVIDGATSIPVHVIHLEGRVAPKRIRSFVDYLVAELRAEVLLKD
jgi:transposase InsO family protein